LIFLSLPFLKSQPQTLQDSVLGTRSYQTEFVFTNLKNKESFVPQVLAVPQTPTASTENTSPTSAPTPTVSPPKPKAPTKPITQFWGETLVTLTNQARAENGLPALQVDSRLVNIARSRAGDMATKNYFSHTSPTGETAFTLLAEAGISYKKAGENIGRNTYADSQTVMIAFQTWMASADHKANILSGDFTHIGIGAAVSASGMKYFTQIFTGS